jgi:MYXO-CTERM domain-containing protein
MNRNSAHRSDKGRAPRASARPLHDQPFTALAARIVLALGAGSLVLASSGAASAQALGGQFPFPSTNVAAGVVTGALTSHELRQLYLDWREALIEQCPQGDARVRYPETNNDTRSEGIGYGMVIAAYMGDQQTFDGLWRYYQRTSTDGLMNWKRNGCDGGGGGGDNGSAADADIDTALALIVAERQFPGNNYGQDATTILGTIRAQLFDGGCQGVLLAGSQFGDCGCINPSYIPPGYYVAYGNVEQQAFWDQARGASYTYFNAVRNPQTGLVPAWSQVSGNLQLGGGCNPQVAGGGGTNEYQADAARTPWRVATDYQWTGDPRAQDFLQSIGGFASSQQMMRIRDRYTLAGQPANTNELSSHELGRNTYVMGGFATAMVAGSQQQLDDFTGAWISVYKSGDNSGGIFRAFNNSLALLYGLVATGTMWNPAGDGPNAMPEPPLTPPTPGNLVVNGDFDEGVLGWEARSDFYGYGGSLQFTNSDGFALHAGGEMRLRVLSNEPDSPERLNFRQQVSVQAGQRYRLSVAARATAPRLLSLAVQGEDAAYGRIAIGQDSETFTVDTEMRTFQAVFEAPTTDPAAVLLFQFGHSSEDVTIDNVVLEPTDLPLDPGSTVGGPAPAPVTPAPGAPPPSAGGGSPPPGDGSLGAVGDLGGDATGAPVSPPGVPVPPGGVTPGMPAAMPGNPSAPSAQNCAPAAYSAELGLCYEATTGQVWDTSQGTWTLPPQVEWCGADEQNPGNFNYWWPLLPACYSPISGYAWNNQLQSWVFVGTNFTRGQNAGSDDAGCNVSGANAGGNGWAGLALLGLAGAAMARRRR